MVRGEYHSVSGRRGGREHPTGGSACTTFSISIATELGADGRASRLDRSAAAELARTEADRRRAGRMFLAGSERPCRGNIVVIVNDKRHHAAGPLTALRAALRAARASRS